jgi:hypothetical protein
MIPLNRWLHLYFKDLGLNSWEMGVFTITRIPPKGGKKQEMVEPVHQGSGVKLLGDGSSHHYKDPSKRGKKQEMVAPVFQGSGVKLVGDESSHHYKDHSKRGKEARDGCACISRIWG